MGSNKVKRAFPAAGPEVVEGPSIPDVVRKPLLACVLSVACGCALFAQPTIHPITEGSIIACTGGFVGSGGVVGGYEDNEDYTATICPDQPGQGIFLTFVSFDLSQDGAAPYDQMFIYNGSDTNAPLIGTYTDGELQGQIVATTPDNPTGCLTVRFTSNAIGTGTFSAAISCGTPCWPPVPDAVIVGETLPAKVCIGEPVQFDASASQPHPGRTIVDYSWDMFDGTVLNGAAVEHAFDEPGQYLVSLTVTDDLGCTNTQQTTVAVWVGTEPLFFGTTGDTTVCANGTIPLQGQTEAVTWNQLPVVDLGGEIALPDEQGVLFTSEIEFSIFPPGATVLTPSDLSTFCVSMEHSFIGDFVLSLTCPNGQNVVMHQQGGGGTYVGDASDATEGIPGECWDYCFSTSATWGTWVESSANGATPHVMPAPSTPGAQTLIPGTYTPIDPFSDFIGCPLNGIWTLNYMDNWGADDGTMCNWSISFDPALYPDLVEFTPVIGTTADSVWWEGDDLTTNAGTPAQASATPTETGVHPYTFHVIDDFGCEHDTTINITVTPPPVVDVTSTEGICTEPSQLLASVVADPPPPLPCTYSLILNDSFGDGWAGGAHVTITINGQATDYTLASGATITIPIEVPFGTPFQVNYTAGTLWNGENSFQLISPAGTLIYSSPNGPLTGNVWNGAGVCAIVSPVTYIWTPNNAVSVNNIPNPTATISAPTFITVAIHPVGQPWCTTQDTITVEPPSVLENDSLITDVLCFGGTGSAEITTTGLGGPWNYRWTDAANSVIREVGPLNGDLLTAPAGDYSVVVTEGPNGNGCSDTVRVTITEPPLLVWSLVPMDTTICVDGVAVLAAETEGGTAPVTYVWDQGLVGSGPHQVSPSDSTVYTVQAVDAHDCITSTVTLLVGVRDSLHFDPLVDFEQCSGVPFDLEVSNLVGGDGNYGYGWSSGNSETALLTDSLVDDATYCVTVSDGCETPPITSCTEITVLHTPAFELTMDTVLGCRPFEVAFALRDTTNGAQVAWRFGEGESAIAGPLLSHIYDRSGTFDVSTEVTWPNGCVTDTSWIDLITVIPVPKPEFSYSPEPLTIFEPHARFTELAGPNEVGYAWDFFDLGVSDEPDPEVTFPNIVGDLYPVQLVVWNELGCSDTLLRYVPVEDAFLIHAPNSFTPNGDDLNEEFRILGNDLSRDEFTLEIFDRWGHVVFSATSPELGWDGKVNGTAAEVGVYVWRLKARSLQTLEKHILYGHVSLLR